MISQKTQEIRNFCEKNADPAIVAKYAKYFKEGYDGYGIDTKIFEIQRDAWLATWKNELTISNYLDLCDKLVSSGKFEEIGFAIHFLAAMRENYSMDMFNRIGKWFEIGIANWGSTDVLCMLVLSKFMDDKIISLQSLKAWTSSTIKWQRRAVPVTLVHADRTNIELEMIFTTIGPLMPDESEDVQKGLGTLLRELWKKHPEETENYLMKWKDTCGRLIIRYATEKMDKDYRKRFRKSK